jgi:hypothetical protein
MPQVIRPTTIARSRWAVALAATGLLLLPSAAGAQLGDPSPGTPQANQYQIPVQAGRHDAAPPRDQGSSGGGGSLYRSNNNFGSSSVVPGDPGGGGPGGPAGGAGAGGGGGVAAGAAAAAGAAGAAVASGADTLDTGSPSTSAAYTTLPLIIILGIVIGIAGVRMRRRDEV